MGTYNRFPDRVSTCRICRETDEASTHLGECPGITNVLGALNEIAQFSPKGGRNRDETIIDNLFIFQKGDAPKAVCALSIPSSME
eukprot:scaffold328381_cov55-Tisochrysis_lutea.AAC.1